jgi:hypothetical protein
MTNSIHRIIIRHNDKIQIASDGGLLNQHATFGAVIAINNILTTELNGSLPLQTHATSLTAEAYA